MAVGHVSANVLSLQGGVDGLTDALRYDVRRATSDTTLTPGDGVVIVSAAIKPVYVALPPAAQNQGRAYVVKKIDPTGNPVQIVCQLRTDTIDGAASLAVTVPYDSRTLVSDGTQWLVIALGIATGGGGGGAPTNATYVTMALDPTLTQERKLTAGSGINIVDSGANNPVTISVIPGAGSGTFVGNIVPVGALPGTIFDLPEAPAFTILVLNGLVIDQVGSATHVDEFSVSGTTITTFRTITSSDKFKAYEAVGSGSFNGNVVPAGSLPGTVFTVPMLGGLNPSLILLVLNGLVLNRVGSAPAIDDFTLSGNTVTTGRTVVATDKFKCFLWY